MAIRREEAFVLKRMPLRETSLLVTLFSRGAGKIKVLVKGARTEKRPIAAQFEPFTHLSIVYYEKLKSDTHLVSETAVLNSNSFLRSRLDWFGYASYLVELVDVLFGFHDPHPDVYELLGSSLVLFQSASPIHVTRVFEVKLLENAGFLPILTHCVLCGETKLKQVFFSPSQGGIVCSSCDRGEPGTIRISSGTIQSLFFFIRSRMEQAVKLRLGQQTERELERIAQKFIQFRLEYALHSPHFLSEIKSLLKK